MTSAFTKKTVNDKELKIWDKTLINEAQSYARRLLAYNDSIKKVKIGAVDIQVWFKRDSQEVHFEPEEGWEIKSASTFSRGTMCLDLKPE